MLEDLMKLFPGASFSQVAQVLGYMAQLMELLGEKYIQDKNAKNALIDALTTMLNAQKEIPPTA